MLSEWWRIKFQHHVDIVIQVIKHFYSGETTPVQWKNYIDNISFPHDDFIIGWAIRYTHVSVAHHVCVTNEDTFMQLKKPNSAR